MKTFILITVTILATTAQAATCSNKNNMKLLSSAAEEIKSAVQDERQVIDRKAPEYKDLNGIGVVTLSRQKGHGTGFLVSPCHVLTNLHVVYNDPKNPKDGQEVQFSAGQTGSVKAPFTHMLVPGKVVAYGGYRNNGGGENGDWAVVKLSKSIGNSVGFIKLYQMDAKATKNRPVTTAGFPGSKTRDGKDVSQIYGDLNCKILGTGVFGFFYHTCQATPGQSGSPILAKSPNDGKLYAIGMVSGGKVGGSGMDRSEDPDNANIAVNFESGKPYDLVSDGDKIVAAIKANKCD